MKKGIYISGKISGLRPEVWISNFNKAEELLKFEFPEADVINPINIAPYKNKTDWRSYMRTDIVALALCDEIYLMKNFWSSKGALMELFVALVLGIKVNFLKMKLAKR